MVQFDGGVDKALHYFLLGPRTFRKPVGPCPFESIQGHLHVYLISSLSCA